MNGKLADAVGPARHVAALELVVGYSSAFDNASNQVALQAVGRVAAIKPVGPFRQIARQVLVSNRGISGIPGAQGILGVRRADGVNAWLTFAISPETPPPPAAMASLYQ